MSLTTTTKVGSANAEQVVILDGSGNQVTSFGGGTQYTEGDTDASITGTAMLLEGAADTLVPAPGTAADGLLVNLGANNDITGSVTANAGTNLNTSALALETTASAIKTSVETIDNAIAGNEMQVDIVSAPTLSVNPHDVSNNGTFVVQENGDALTSLQLIDDTVATLGTTTYTEATTKGLTMGAVRRDADTTLVNTTNEIGPLQMDANGRLKVEAFSGETLPVSLTSTTITGTVAVTQSGTWDEVGINDSGNSITVDNGGTFVVQENGAALTSLQLIDDVVYTDDTSTHSTGSSKGALFMAAATPTDTSVNANDIGAVAMTTDRKLHVSVQDSLPAGTNAIGKLSANSGVDIGDVDVTSVSGNVTVIQGTATNLKTQAESYQGGTAVGSGNPLQVTLANTGANATAVKVDGSAVTQPVSGTITATISAGATTIAKAEDAASADADVGVPAMAVRKATPANTSGLDGDYEMLQMSAGRLWTSSTIDAALPAGSNAIGKLAANDGVDIGDVTINNSSIPVTDNAGSLTVDAPVGTPVFVRLSDGAAAISTLPVSLASVPSHAVTNAGTFAVQVDGSALTSLQLIDDTVYTDDAAFTPATSKVLAIGAEADETATDSVDEGDIGALRMTLDRKLYVQNAAHGKTIISTGGSASSSGNNTLITADASNKIKVAAFSLSTTSTTAMTCIFQDGASGTELWRVIIQATTGASAGANLAVPVPAYLFSTSTNTLLNLNLSSANAVHWSISYFKEAT